MDNVGVLILFAIVGAFICAKARVAGGAVVFGAIAVVLFVSTPAGQGVPSALIDFLSAINNSTSPALTGESVEPAPGPEPASGGAG